MFASSEPRSPFKFQLILQRRPTLDVTLEPDGSTLFQRGHSQVRLGPSSFAVLQAFMRPVTVLEALQLLPARSATAVAEACAIAHEMYQAGILIEPAVAQLSPGTGFGDPFIHSRMLNDRQRTDDFRSAIRAAIRPGDVVVEIGTGTGVLTLAAVEAGARHVYTIEATGMADVAQTVFERAGVADRITIIRGWSTQVEVPERGDVIVSEILGNDPLDEGAIPLLIDARERFAKPGAAFVPERLEIHLNPVMVPEEELENRVLREEDFSKWESWYGADFRALGSLEQHDSRPFRQISPRRAADWIYLTESIPIFDFQFAANGYSAIAGSVTRVIEKSGTMNGLIVNFVAALGACNHSVHPKEASADCSWRIPVYYVPGRVNVKPGDSITIHYESRGRRGWVFSAEVRPAVRHNKGDATAINVRALG